MDFRYVEIENAIFILNEAGNKLEPVRNIIFECLNKNKNLMIDSLITTGSEIIKKFSSFYGPN